MAVELAAIEAWLFSRLVTTVGPGAEIYTDQAPEDAPYPFVIMAHLGGSDVFGVGPARFMTSADYVIRATVRSESLADVYPLADDIDAAIHGQKGVDPLVGLTVLSCVRTEPFRQREVEDDVVYLSLGGVYRCRVEGGI